MRTGHRGMLAALHRNMIDATGLTYEPIEWWIYRLAPPAALPRHPPRPIDNLFILHHESGRRWFILQGSIETDFLHKLYSGELTCWGRLESSLAPYVRAPAGAITAIESWWKGGGILRLESGERLFAARVEPTNAAEGRFSMSELRGWLRDHHAARRASGKEPTERDDYQAAKRMFPGVSRNVVREERQEILSSDLLRPGRRSAVGK